MSTPRRIVGQGPHTVFCLHGWFGSAQGWGAFPECVDIEQFRYVFVDYRGYGSRLETAGEFTVEEISADVRALADELGAATYSLVGHSMGGTAVLRTLVDAPERVNAVVGISPVGASPFPFDDAGRTLFFDAPGSLDTRQTIIGFTSGSRCSPAWVGRMAQQSWTNSTQESFGGHLRSWASPDFAARIPRQVPALVVTGQHDPALGAAAQASTWMTYFSDVQAVDLANAAHFAPFETPVALATCVEAFLQQHTHPVEGAAGALAASA